MTGEWRPRHNPWAIALTVTLATFMEVLDTSIANVALPHIAGNLSAGQDAATWVLTSYLVSNAVVLPLSGWLSVRFGRKRFYMTCVALFAVSSFLCGIAPSLGWLIFFRVLQGVGGGGLAPSEQAILADTFPPEKRGMAFAVYGMAVVLAPAIGPTLGGYITDTTTWRWIFFINVPVGIVSLLLTQRLVEDPPEFRRERAGGVDWIGLSLIVIGFSTLQLVLDKGERDDWFGSNTIRVATAIAVITLIGAALWEWFRRDPILEVRLLASRGLGVGCVMMFMLGLALFGTTVLLPLFLQTLLGYTALEAGKTLSPGGLVVLLILPLVGRLIQKVQARWLIAFGFLSTALALFHMTQISLDIDFSTAMKYRIYQSIGLAFLFVPINTIAYVGVPREKSNQVSALTNLARNIGGSVGISLATTLVSRRAQLHQTRLVEHLTPYDEAFRERLAGLAQTLVARGADAVEAMRQATGIVYGAMVRQAVTLAYVDTLKVLALACACMLPLVLLLPRNQPGATPAGAH
jgi:DHA2 family multidrug resistance protein